MREREIVEALIGGFESFISDYWGRKPVVHHVEPPQLVTGLLTLERADAILASPATRPPYVEMTQNGVAVREKVWVHRVGSPSLAIPDAVNVNILASEFAKGATLILNHLDDYDEQNLKLCEAFEAVFGMVTKTVAFITPPQQQGLGVHYDTFEGFIMQTHGRKTWRVWPQVTPLPIKPLGYRPEELSGEPILTVTLEAGDCLYLPWGSPHCATTEGEISSHVTVMVFPRSWNEVAEELMLAAIPASAFDEIVSPITSDAALWGRLSETLAELPSLVDESQASQFASAGVRRQASTKSPERNLLSRSVSGYITAESIVTRQPGTTCWLEPSDDACVIHLERHALRVPARYEPLLRVLVEADCLPLSSLCSEWKEDTVVRLASTLATHGLLTAT